MVGLNKKAMGVLPVAVETIDPLFAPLHTILVGVNVILGLGYTITLTVSFMGTQLPYVDVTTYEVVPAGVNIGFNMVELVTPDVGFQLKFNPGSWTPFIEILSPAQRVVSLLNTENCDTIYLRSTFIF